MRFTLLHLAGNKLEPIIVQYSKKDHNLIISHKWHIVNGGYVGCSRKINGEYLLHRIIMQPQGDITIDHLNGDRADNRRKNLQLVSMSINIYRSSYKNKTGQRGITKKGNSYRAFMTIKGNKIYLGSSIYLEVAIKIYKDACLVYYGELPQK